MTSAQRTPTVVAVVLAAGLGTRMKSRTPKVLHPLLGRPMLAYVLDAARAATGGAARWSSTRRRRARSATRSQIRADMALQAEPIGTGDALRAGLAAVPADADEVLVLIGDVPRIHPRSPHRRSSNSAGRPGQCSRW